RELALVVRHESSPAASRLQIYSAKYPLDKAQMERYSYIRPLWSDMLKLSKKSDYGLIAVKHLAEQVSGMACNTKEIAKAYGIPSELLAKVLQKLVKNGLLVSQHGAEGGYALARHPSTVTAFDVIRA